MALYIPTSDPNGLLTAIKKAISDAGYTPREIDASDTVDQDALRPDGQPLIARCANERRRDLAAEDLRRHGLPVRGFGVC